MSRIESPQISPFLWFNDRAEEAVNFYTSVFPDSRIETMTKWSNGFGFPEDKVMAATFYLSGTRFHAFDAGPQFTFNESISFFVVCKDQKEVDYYWEKLTEDGEEQPCGWVKDKFGVSWQIVPEFLRDMLAGGKQDGIKSMFTAVMKMKKFDVEELKQAYEKGI